MASNQVELKSGIITITQAGDQTYESITAITTQVQKLSANLETVKVLVDHRHVGKLDIGARRAGFEAAKNVKFHKMAFFGPSPYLAGTLNLLARSVGKQHQIHIAKTREEALKWLG